MSSARQFKFRRSQFPMNNRHTLKWKGIHLLAQIFLLIVDPAWDFSRTNNFDTIKSNKTNTESTQCARWCRAYENSENYISTPKRGDTKKKIRIRTSFSFLASIQMFFLYIFSADRRSANSKWSSGVILLQNEKWRRTQASAAALYKILVVLWIYRISIWKMVCDDDNIYTYIYTSLRNNCIYLKRL